MLSVRASIVAVSGLLVLAAGYLLASARRQAPELLGPIDPHADGRETEAVTEDEIAELRALCARRAAVIRQQFPRRYRVIVHRPFVIVGDFEESHLRSVYAHTILPTARGLHAEYFARHPMQPVTILMISNTRAYQAYARSTQHSAYANYYGYYRRDQQLVVVNAATGSGTLAHELTHVLTDVDFPNMPQWFNEGFAALHEEVQVRPADGFVRGLPNWRLRSVAAALETRQLQTIHSLVTSIRLRPAHEQLDCAHARLICLFLQQQGLLAEFYQRLRKDVVDDPSGAATLQEVLGGRAWPEIETEFRVWLERIHDAFLRQAPDLRREPVAELDEADDPQARNR